MCIISTHNSHTPKVCIVWKHLYIIKPIPIAEVVDMTETQTITKNVSEAVTVPKFWVYSIALLVATVSYIVTYVAIQASGLYGVLAIAAVGIPVLRYLNVKAVSNNEE